MKRVVEQNLPEDSLTIIKIANSEKRVKLKWIKEGREFIYKSLLYDIVREKTTKDTILYYCIKDLEEQELIFNYQKITNIQNPISKDRNNNLNNLLSRLWQNYVCSIFQYSFAKNYSVISFYPKKYNLLSSLKEIPTPPPQI